MRGTYWSFIGLILVAAVAAAPTWASAAAGGGQILVGATLTGSQEVPRQSVKVVAAKGRLSGTLKRTPKGYTLTWRLTFSGLSGRAQNGYIHHGKRGAFGAALIHLCSPCTSGAHGTAYVAPGEVDLMRGGKAYVNVRTAENPSGEIRGQISLLG